VASATFTYSILTGGIATAGSIKNWAQYSLIPATQILEQAQQYIYQRLRIEDMTVEEPITIASDAYTMAKPTGFLAPVWIKLDGDYEELDYVHENMLKRYVDEDGVVEPGRPSRYSIFNNLIQFDVANEEDSSLNGDMLFYKTPDLLAADTNETNFLTDRFATLLLDTCIAFAYKHRRRPETNGQFLLAEKAINDANVAADFQRRGQLVR